ncbi:hypothetical protein POVWA2_050040 [Plasmodium ovale wallikeri]|uniref:Uncharacterized protein n=1 Tax=Plasmodium ovale wallikeri TaxID=864142 RepID=A0A1A8ZNN9_PLAOA|nr:hypothetical protein POVWA1_001370 [Plasmodium ovale wallikeri]SBT45481.1 hypothetical protein POVWA2_050040 [Plasmodium ovale wallikeri]
MNGGADFPCAYAHTNVRKKQTRANKSRGDMHFLKTVQGKIEILCEHLNKRHNISINTWPLCAHPLRKFVREHWNVRGSATGGGEANGISATGSNSLTHTYVHLRMHMYIHLYISIYASTLSLHFIERETHAFTKN